MKVTFDLTLEELKMIEDCIAKEIDSYKDRERTYSEDILFKKYVRLHYKMFIKNSCEDPFNHFT